MANRISRYPLPVKLDPGSVAAIIDSREQLPLDLAPLRTELATLSTGDYSLKGLKHHVCIERKSLDDLLGCAGRDGERFERELQRMLAHPVRVLLVESMWADIELGQWRSKVTSSQVMGRLIGWAAIGNQVAMRSNNFAKFKTIFPALFLGRLTNQAAQGVVGRQ